MTRGFGASNFLFRWRENTALKSTLAKSIKAASLQMRGAMPGVLTLWHDDGSWLKISTDMVDLDDRREVGVLAFEVADSEPAYSEIVFFEGGALEVSRAHRLTIEEGWTIDTNGIVVEAGIVLETKLHGSITILASSFPYALAVDGIFKLPRVFQPEYELDAYKKSALIEASGHSGSA